MKFLFLLLFGSAFLLSIQSSQASFHLTCLRSQEASEENDNKKQIEWLSIIFETEDCNKIEFELKKLKSFNSIIPIKAESKKYQKFDLKPQELKTNPEFLIKHQSKWTEYTIYFRNLTLFQEFKNLVHFNAESIENICPLINEVPTLKSISLTAAQLTNSNTECITNHSIKIYISGVFEGVEVGSPLAKLIIGIEDYNGELRKLRNYENLYYLGIENFEPYANLRDLSRIRNLSNLYLNLKNVATIEDIGRLKSLKFLTLNCIDNEPGTFIPNQDIDKCNGHKLHHIEFLTHLLFLKGLDLSWNAIEDINPISKLKNLEYLNLSMNLITELKSFNDLVSLKKVIVRNNNIKTLSGLNDSLIIYELEGNQIDKKSDCPTNTRNLSIRKFCNSI